MASVRNIKRASEVLKLHLSTCLSRDQSWTSYFVKYSDIYDDDFGKSNYDVLVGDTNFQILRTGCWPYVKYHCTKTPSTDLQITDKVIRISKTLAFPACIGYGVAAFFLLRSPNHGSVQYKFGNRQVVLYFLLDESKRQQEFFYWSLSM
jgi:hypothetical protein